MLKYNGLLLNCAFGGCSFGNRLACFIETSNSLLLLSVGKVYFISSLGISAGCSLWSHFVYFAHLPVFQGIMLKGLLYALRQLLLCNLLLVSVLLLLSLLLRLL